jgi:hypothetical protein
MKKHPLSMFFLISLLIITCFSFSAYAQTENGGAIHQYLDIPFDNITTEGVDQIVLGKTGAIEKNEFGYYLISDYGYDFKMQVDFNEELFSINRIFLSTIENGWGKDDEFRTLIERDVLQFMDMETQLIGQYGEPDWRGFMTVAENYSLKGSTIFMFSDSTWNTDQMMQVCNKDKYFIAYSTWGNVTLRLWVNWLEEYKRGYLTKLDLYFLRNLPQVTFPSIVEYPPVSFH